MKMKLKMLLLILKMTKFEPADRPDCEKLLDSEEMKNWKSMID